MQMHVNKWESNTQLHKYFFLQLRRLAQNCLSFQNIVETCAEIAYILYILDLSNHPTYQWIDWSTYFDQKIDGGGVKMTLFTLASTEHIEIVTALKLIRVKMIDETNQFIFIKKLNEWSRNESVESLQEGVDLRLDSTSHSQLRHQLDVLCLKDTHMHTHAHTNTSILHFTLVA